jgi:Cu(I)/Ag(I) efflux system membrane protein CusA/SilA
VVRWSLRWKWSVIALAAALTIVTVPVFTHLGSEFAPPARGVVVLRADDTSGISIGEVQKLLQVSDRTIRKFRGRSRARQGGRADEHRSRAALDARDGIALKPASEWRRVHIWYWGGLRMGEARVRHVTPDHISEENWWRR